MGLSCTVGQRTARHNLERFYLLCVAALEICALPPSPRPSPSGRGRIVSCRFEKSCAGLAECSFVNRATICGDSLSTGERAGVRGNAAPAHQIGLVRKTRIFEKALKFG